MNRFVNTALAIAVAGSAAHAGTGDNEWTALDSEISGLASPLKQSQDGNGWAALLRAVYSYSSDELFKGGPDNPPLDPEEPDLNGFGFNDIDLAFWGSQGSYTWRVSADLDGNDIDEDESGDDFSSSLALEDAYIRWNCGGYFDGTFGNYKPRLSLSNSVDPERQLFIDRSALGSAGDWWDQGVGVSGVFDQFAWYGGLMNGSNGHTRDHFYYVRGEFNIGTGAGVYEGAMGSSDTLNGTVGLTFVLDNTLDFTGTTVPSSGGDLDNDGNADSTAWILDFGGNLSNIGFGAEIAVLDDDFRAFTDEDYSNIFDRSDNTFLTLAEDSMPWSVYGSFLISPEWEVAVRYEDLDNGDLLRDDVTPGNTVEDGPDNTILSIGANWYTGSNAGKWQVQWSLIDADSGFDDGNILEVGYAVGTTR
jgi:hypothetical protein